MAEGTNWENISLIQVGKNKTKIGGYCCLTDHDKVKTLAIVYGCTSTLSIIGAGSIIFFSLWKKIVNSPEVQPLFHLAVANFLLAVASVIGVILWSAESRSDCFYINCVEETLIVISFFLTVNYSINAYIRLKERTFKIHNLLFTTVSTNNFFTWMFRGLYFSSWIIPVAIILPLIVKFINMDKETKNSSLSCSRCLFLFDHPKFPRQISTNSKKQWPNMYNSLMMILSLALSFLLLLILYYMTERIYNKTLIHSGFHTNSQRKSMANMRKRIGIFILIFVICWLPAFVIACADLHKSLSRSSSQCDQPYIILALTSPLQGFLNSIVYGWTRITFRSAATRRKLSEDRSVRVQSYGSLCEM